MSEIDLYAGISGARLEVETFDLGYGVSISQTYAHLMAPFLVAFFVWSRMMWVVPLDHGRFNR